jgi:hypothetical protein
VTKPYRAAVALLLLVMGAVQLTSVLGETQTWDEAGHLTAAYLYLKTGQTAFYTEHPPLRAVFALPLLFFHLRLPIEKPDWRDRDRTRSGTWFLYTNGYHPDTLLIAARSVAIALTLAFGLVLVWWTRRQFGPKVAIVALALFCLDPNLIAHGRYVTTDMLSAFTFFLAVISFSSAGLQALPLWAGRPAPLWTSGVALAFALVAKYSAISLIPIFALLGLAAWWQRRIEARRLVHSLAVVFGIAALTVLLIYAPETIRWIAGRTAEHPFLTGLSEVIRKSREGHESYLLGQYSQTGWWYYFPVVFAVKTPLGLLAMLAIGLGGLVGVARYPGRLRKANFAWLAMAIPAATFFALSMMNAVNLGVRHILPVYPLLCVLAAALVMRLPRGPMVAAVCVAALAFESAWIYPNYLAFFNAVAGGPKAGPRYLLDSNLDWGQDVKKLRTWMHGHGIDSVCMFYFGTTGVEFYGVPTKYLPRTWETAGREQMDCVAAISVTNLYDLYVPRGSYAWLREKQPDARIGWSIYVYDLRKRAAGLKTRPGQAAGLPR